jgi:hypothetical protein
MSLPTFQLGDYTFLTFARFDNPAAPPALCSPQVRAIDREGVNGTGLMRTGERGKPFQYRSTSDYSTMAKAQSAQQGYDDMIGRKRFTLIWADVNYRDQHGCQYLVTDVSVTQIKRLSAMTGGFVTQGYGFLVEALWTLIAVPAS